MKDIYTEKLNDDNSSHSVVTEPVVDSYVARKPQEISGDFSNVADDASPCSYTDEEMLNMLEEIEKDDLYIPDYLVRKMFA